MFWTLLACQCAQGPVEDAGLMGQGLMWPFPNAQLMVDGRVSIPSEAVPYVDTPMPTERLAWRDGFSPVQTAVIQLDDVDAGALPGAGSGLGGSVRLIDLDTGEELLCFAELDADPAARTPALLIRPLEAMQPGHRVAVVVTTDAAARPERIQDLLDGRPPDDMSEEVADGTLTLFDELADLGVATNTIAVAGDFPVGDPTPTLRQVMDGTEIPESWEITKVVDSDEDPNALPEGVWRKITGTYTTTNWLPDDFLLDMDADGAVYPSGEVEAELYIQVPESVRDKEPGTVPVVVFGHGLLRDPALILNDDSDIGHFVELFNRMEVIVVATTWRGLTRKDSPDVVWTANDMGRFPEVTERLHQGVANTSALSRMVIDGDLLDEPSLEGLADPSAVSFYGVSLGGIMGAVTMANSPWIDRGVLHVAGSSWGVTFTRSANYKDFGALVEDGIRDPLDRQLVYALTQLFWDPVDPANYGPELAERDVLLQYAVNDDEVSNLGTELLARAAGWPLLAPSSTTPVGLSTGTFPVNGPAVVQFDPLLGDPDNGNQPATVTNAHREPRKWESAKLQSIDFLVAEPGMINHYCGAEVCTPD